MTRERVGAIIEDGGRFFMVKLHNTDFFHLVGGGVDDGESLHDALKREIKEEVGVSAEVGQLLAVHRLIDNGKTVLTSFIFYVKNADHFHDIDLSETTHGEIELAEAGFIDADKERVLPSELVPILDELKLEGYAGPVRILETEREA